MLYLGANIPPVNYGLSITHSTISVYERGNCFVDISKSHYVMIGRTFSLH